MIPTYTPQDWYWVVAGDKTRAWSSKCGAFVTDASLWQNGATNIASMNDLNTVLRGWGLPVAAPELADFDAAIRAHIDAVARDRDFDNGDDATTFAASTQSAWSAEALAFIAWRDSVWLAFDAAKSNLPATPAEFIAGLTPIAWPSLTPD